MFWLKVTKNRQKVIKSIDIYYIGYISMKSISLNPLYHSAKPVYFIVGKVDGFIEESNENKYLVSASTDKNKEVLESTQNFKMELKSWLKGGEYGKDLVKIRCASDDNFPLNKTMKLYNLTVIVRSVFQEDSKYYPQVFLDECLYEL